VLEILPVQFRHRAIMVAIKMETMVAVAVVEQHKQVALPQAPQALAMEAMEIPLIFLV